MTVVAGVDGCRAGWIAVLRDLEAGAVSVRVVSALADLFAGDDAPAVAAVDMPIGLPERVGAGGRGAERAVRGFLGERQSSVFSVPSRSAVYMGDYMSACEAAFSTSDPPRRVSKQCFHLFPKMREVDALLRGRPELRDRVVESHPEVAFAVLSGAAMRLPKKIKGSVNPAGTAERRAFLAARGLGSPVLPERAPRGSGEDDLLDASVCSLVAERVLRGTAVPHPAEEIRDAFGLRIAIWA
jgi:predicted RNase H-like nuclease